MKMGLNGQEESKTFRRGSGYELYGSGGCRACSGWLARRLENLICRMRAAPGLQRFPLDLGLQLRIYGGARFFEPRLCASLSHVVLGRTAYRRELRRSLVWMADADRPRARGRIGDTR